MEPLLTKEDIEKEIYFLEDLCSRSTTTEKEREQLLEDIKDLNKRKSHLDSINVKLHEYMLNG